MDYANGKIYAIRSPNMEKYYIGSCITKLEKRFYAHKHKKNYCTSKIVIEADDAYIELIEVFPCKSKIELNKREGELQRQYKNEIVNCRIEGRTKKEYCEDNKEHLAEYYKQRYENNKEHIAEYKEDNKEKIAEYQKEYTEDHKEQRKQYHEKNKEQIAEQRKQYHEKNKEQEKKYREDNKEKIAEQRKQLYQKNKLEKENNNI